jgi:N-methylhydantoinase A
MEMLGIPKIDVRSVGAGGGSIAWIDPGGLLRVGPQSAGARPGPACYGHGGTEATVTDANVLLGIIDPGYFLGGRMRLDRAKAEAAIGKVAVQLGKGLVETAYAIHTTSNHNMIAAIEDITIIEGIDPRESYLVSGGGATACHIGAMAGILGIKSFMVPKFAAGLSAYGGLISDVRWGEMGTLHTNDRHFNLAGVNRLLDDLRRRGESFLERSGFAPDRRRFEYAYQGRYLYQSWDIEVAFDCPSGTLSVLDLATLVAAFHRTHEQIYSIKDESDIVEFTTWKVRAIGDAGGAARRGSALAPQSGPPQPKGRRGVYLSEATGVTDVPVYDGALLGAGAVISGPAIVEEPTTTVLLHACQRTTVDGSGNFLIDVLASS